MTLRISAEVLLHVWSYTMFMFIPLNNSDVIMINAIYYTSHRNDHTCSNRSYNYSVHVKVNRQVSIS